MRPTSFNAGTPHDVVHNVVLFILEVSLFGLITAQVATWVHYILMDTVNHYRGYQSVIRATASIPLPAARVTCLHSSIIGATAMGCEQKKVGR